MTRRRGNPWVGISLDAWRLGLDASTVIMLRSLKIARGGGIGEEEARLMISEKVEAAATLHAKAFNGQLGVTTAGASAKTLAHYGRNVRANKRRLLKELG